MRHIQSHPAPVDGCFGCQTLHVGVQTLQIKHGNDPVEKAPVIADDGARAGRTVGQTMEHWDGRRDATAYAPQLTIKTQAREI